MKSSGITPHIERRDPHGFVKESAGFGIAEFVSMGVSLGVVGIADQVAPDTIKHASKVIAKTLIEPHLDFIEKTQTRLCKLKDCQPDKNKPRSERAEDLAKTLLVFSSAWVISMAAKFGTRRYLNKHLGLKDPPVEKTGSFLKDKVLFKILHPNEWRIGLADEGVHYGSLLLLNTGAAEYTDDLIDATSNMLQKIGFSKKKAHELSSMAMIWELPNLLGLAAGTGVIYGKHKYGWGEQRRSLHVDRLLDSTIPHGGPSHP